MLQSYVIRTLTGLCLNNTLVLLEEIMAQKTDISVVINGKVFMLSGFEGEEYLQNIASYINSKIAECRTSEQYRRMNTEYQGMLLSINIADAIFNYQFSGAITMGS